MNSQNHYSFKLKLSNNPRYVVILLFLTMSLLITTALLFLLKTFLFLFAALVIFFLICIIIFTAYKRFPYRIDYYDDRLEVVRSKNETDIMFFKDLRVAGFYKHNFDSEKFASDDGLYIYNEEADYYILIGKGFDYYKKLYSLIKESAEQYNIFWHDILHTDRNSLINGIKKII